MDERPDEFALIRQYFSALTPAPDDVPLGIGDDAALLRPSPGVELAVSTDTLIAGRHFPERTAPADIGWKALAVNLSDLAAMGAEPWVFTLALSLPEADPQWLRGFADGLGALARESGIALVGGDTTRGPLAITITVIGRVPVGRALRRSGAKVGNRVCVTGTLGDAALGLRRLDDPAAAMLMPRLNRPTPRWAAGIALRGLAHAAIDLSDGLAGDLRHVLDASGVGAEIGAHRLPGSPAFDALVLPHERLALQAGGGDDYELCFCIPPARVDEARALCAPLSLTVIGSIVREPGLRFVDTNGTIMPFNFQAYNHFP
ncbi:MAG TPA: thiamine-phosphate kinase [Solimonas sp.]